MDDELTRLQAAVVLVYEYVKARLERTDTHVTFSHDEVYIVWFCKTLQNWKALLSTTLPDGMYYEVTFDGDKDKAYIDAYKKFENVSVSLRDDIDVPIPNTRETDIKSQYAEPRA